VTEPQPGDHYSYSVYADPATAKSFDARRFGGPIGQMVASAQADVLERFAGPIRNRRILDVGTGTGRAAIIMAQGGGCVTAVDPSEEMLEIARRRAAEASLSIRFAAGDAHRLEFSDRAFDVVISLRVLMHAADWPRCLAELCRVSGQLVIIDYPSAHSAALFQAMARRVMHRFGARTEPYRVLSDSRVAGELHRAGFRIRSAHRQFVLPIALHKALGSRRFSERTRAWSERLGLLRLFGSPVTIVAERW
jgi:2-polyprenyl-3-methyl-5-hydroxy-6-metoxy-1,4-benzoquinol methylase